LGGSGALAKLGSGVLVLSASNSFSGGSTLVAGKLSISSDANIGGATSPITFSGGILQVTGTALVNLNNHAVNWSSFNGGLDILAGGNTFTITQALSDSGNLTKLGTGTLVLSGSNSFTGITLVNTGTLTLANALALGQSTFDSGGTGKLSFGTLTAATFGGLQGTGGLSLLNSGSAAVALGVGNNNASTTLSGLLSGSGSLRKVGTGTLTLSATNTYTGGTTLIAGEIAVSSDANIGGATSAITFSGGVLAVGGVVVANLNTHAVNWSSFNGGFDILAGGNTFTITQFLAGSGGLAKLGPGTLVLSASNSFSGLTRLNGGTLTLANSSALGQSTLDMSANAMLSFGTLAAATLGGLQDAGSIALVNDSSSAVTLSVGKNNTSTSFSGTLSGSGSLKKIGSGTLVLSGSDSYSGGTTVLGGALDIESVYALPGNSTLAIANTAEVMFGTDLGSAIQLSLMLPGAAGGDPGMTYFHVTANAPGSVPEPGTFVLFAAAMLTGAVAWRRRRSMI
jgi:fibronectin-binding autotransporter adhesin